MHGGGESLGLVPKIQYAGLEEKCIKSNVRFVLIIKIFFCFSATPPSR